MTRFFAPAVEAAADEIAEAALQHALFAPAAIRVAGGAFHVTVVAAPAGAGKTYFVGSFVQAALAANGSAVRSVAVSTPTNSQAFDLVRSLAQRLPDGVQLGYLPARSVVSDPDPDKRVPQDLYSIANVDVLDRSTDANSYSVIVGTIDKLGDACARGDLETFRTLGLDEAYQADASKYYRVADLAPRHLLVGDPGQLDPWSTIGSADRWRGQPEDPLQTAVGVILRNHGTAVVPFRLPITRRLPSTAIPVAAAFYPEHRFDAWTVPGARRMRLLDTIGTSRAIDGVLDSAAQRGWAHLQLPGISTLPDDPDIVERLVDLTGRVLARGAEVSSESTEGRFERLRAARIAIGVSHTVQRDAVRDGLDAAGVGGVRVDTANRLQGLEFDLVLAWHPLAGLPSSDEWQLDPGRMCVLLSRHRHACIVVGRSDADMLLGTVPPPAETYLGTTLDPVTEGWFAHKAAIRELAPFTVSA